MSQNSKVRRVVVVGNGMVGHRFWEAWTADERSQGWQAVCLAEEVRPAYDRIHLSEYFTHRDASQLALADATWYAERGQC